MTVLQEFSRKPLTNNVEWRSWSSEFPRHGIESRRSLKCKVFQRKRQAMQHTLARATVLIRLKTSASSEAANSCAEVRVRTVEVVAACWCLSSDVCVDGTTVGTACEEMREKYITMQCTVDAAVLLAVLLRGEVVRVAVAAIVRERLTSACCRIVVPASDLKVNVYVNGHCCSLPAVHKQSQTTRIASMCRLQTKQMHSILRSTLTLVGAAAVSVAIVVAVIVSRTGNNAAGSAATYQIVGVGIGERFALNADRLNCKSRAI